MVDFIYDHIAAIRAEIASAAQAAGRGVDDVKLMGVSKFHPLEMMLRASDCIDLLGENRVQEAVEKRAGWPPENKTPWHLIGHLQKNKARKALEIFDLIESVDGFDLAKTLDRIVAETGRATYPVYIEVNMSGEEAKNGIALRDAEKLLEQILIECPHLRVEGLMTIGPLTDDEKQVRVAFAGLYAMRGSMREKFGLALPELSMGMSGDFKVAIEEGSTIVRVGTAIFGSRNI